MHSQYVVMTLRVKSKDLDKSMTKNIFVQQREGSEKQHDIQTEEYQIVLGQTFLLSLLPLVLNTA